MVAGKALKGAEAIFLALLIIGLMGLLFLIIYGNLAGNLGFARDTATTINETGGWLNTTLYTVAGKSQAGYIGFTVTEVLNLTGGAVIPTANYTVDSAAGTITNATTSTHVSYDINISYVITFKAVAERNTDAVIGNLTSGATQFFSFSNVWFILTAITILIAIVLGVISLVRKASGSGFGSGKSGKSEFTT